MTRRSASRDPICGSSGRATEGSPAKVHRDPFHQHLVLREDRVATVAPFAVASTTPNLFDAVVRQTPVPDLALDEKTERFLVHSGLAGSSGRERTPNSPGSRRPEAPTWKARCRRREGSTTPPPTRLR